MTLWCQGMPVVTVKQTEAPKHVCLVYPYYENPRFLEHQVAHWRTYPYDLRFNTSAIVVDDGSPQPALLPSNAPLSLRLFRIEVDVRWNWLAARNIGAHHAPVGWMLLTDMDHVVPEATLRHLVYGKHDSSIIYAFRRQEHTGSPATPHSASFFMTKLLFWQIGGYDETLSGHYGTDGDWRRRCAQYAQLQILDDVLVRHEYQGDSSTIRYLRKQPQDAEVKRLVARRTPKWRPKVLSFPYHEVT